MPSFLSTSTPTPAPTSTPTATPTVKPTPDTSDPLFIESLRQYRSDPPPTIELVDILAETDHFTQYQIAYISDGLRITGILNVPIQNEYGLAGSRFDFTEDNLTRWPVILLNHGHYAPNDYFSGKGTELEAAYLAQHGYVTIASDYRGFGDSEGPPGDHFDPGWTHDVLNLLDTLPNLAFVDSERVGIWGHSTGGEIALQVITARDNVDAVVLFGSLGADASDNLPLVLAEGRHQADMAIQRYGLPQESPEVWAKLSPITYLADVSAPISIHHGDLDSEVPPDLSFRLWQAMQTNNLPGEYFTYPHQGHFFAGQAWNLAMERTLAFFDQYVKE
jgi:dipeptidyl aminopeptidase/acylaminoacyl peptidase